MEIGAIGTDRVGAAISWDIQGDACLPGSFGVVGLGLLERTDRRRAGATARINNTNADAASIITAVVVDSSSRAGGSTAVRYRS